MNPQPVVGSGSCTFVVPALGATPPCWSSQHCSFFLTKLKNIQMIK